MKTILEIEDSHVWRYMSLSRFKEVISEGKIYFANPKQFKDPNEFLLQEINGKERDISILTNMYGVNCWHLNNFENILMWKTYISPDEIGIALKVNFKNLSKIFSPRKVSIKKVKYVDAKTQKKIHPETIGNLLVIDDFMFVKTNEYRGENEIRVTAIKEEFSSNSRITLKNKLLSLDEEGFFVPFNIKFVDAIILHPQISTAEIKYFKEIKKNTNSKFRIEKSLMKEKLSGD